MIQWKAACTRAIYARRTHITVMQMEIFMKRVIPNLLLFFCLIPWGGAMVFTVIDCIFNLKYLDWLWIPDFCMVIFDLISYYLIELAAFAMFGIFSAYIFFGRTYRAVILTVSAFAATVILPFSRYLIRHMLLTDVMYDIAMLDYFYDDWLFVQTLFINAILFLFAVLLTKLFHRMILKNGVELPSKLFEIRNPQNIAALIFCAAALVLATILFFSVGDYSLEGVLSLVVEYFINAVRFFVCIFVSFITVKWNKQVYKKI